MKNNNIKICKPATDNGNMICPYDYCAIVKKDIIRAKYGNSIMSVPTYYCPLCNREYTSIRNISDLAVIKLQGDRFINLNLPQGKIRTKLKDPEQEQGAAKKTKTNKTKREYISKDSASGYVLFSDICTDSICLDSTCRGELKDVTVYYLNAKKGPTKIKGKRCSSCGKYCFSIKEYVKDPQMMTCINDGEIIQLGKKLLYERKDLDENDRTKLESWYDSHDKQVFFYCNVILAHDKYLSQIEEKNKAEFQKIEQQAEKEKPNHKDNEIKVRDFLIKRSVFRCVHDEHELEDINAVISVVTNSGNLEQVSILAGYCRSCNVYFVLEDQLRRLLSKGTPMCLLYDWDKTEKALHPGSMFLAPESLLYQYGYNVNSIDNIPAAKRQRILATMIDNDVMTKNEILSYLDLFITQRKDNRSMNRAVEKWKEDIAFLLQYKAVGNDSVRIRSLYRRGADDGNRSVHGKGSSN